MVDLRFKGHRLTPIEAVVEAGRLRAFLAAIGETNVAFTAPDAGGRAAIPPTYLFCLEMLDAANPFGFVEEIGISIDSILHADQGFVYHAPVHVGDRLTFSPSVRDIVVKKGGMLTFVSQDVAVTNQDGLLVAEISRTFVVRGQETVAA